MKHIVETKVLQDVLNYLATRPYSEVATLIQTLQQTAQPLLDKKDVIMDEVKE